jgi:sensor domain CHASE-containing protein
VVITDFSGKVIYSEVVDPTNLGAYPVTQRELIAAVQERTGASDYLSEKKKLDDMREDQQVADRMLKEMQNAPEK